MLEIKPLGIKGTGSIDGRYGTERTASFSIFECPVCLRQYELITYKGKTQNTCIDCRGTQKITHDKSKTREYHIWQGMRQRCSNPKNIKYHLYGGKGVTVDPNWDTFSGFWEDMSSTYEDNLTIDRKDSSKGYTKDNCRWITRGQNSSETSKRRAVCQFRIALVPTRELVFMQEFESAKRAADTLGLIAAHITVVCEGKRKTHGGFAWTYK